MSTTPATDDFKAAWEDATLCVPRTLVKIEFAVPSALTIRVASAETIMPDGTIWEAGLGPTRVRARIDAIGTGPNPADCTLTLDRVPYAGLTGVPAETMAGLLWHGAKVTVYLWNDVRDSAGDQVLAAADLLQQFTGLIDSYSVEKGQVTLNCMQPQLWNKEIPDTVVDKSTYPNSPEGQQSQPVPMFLGDAVADPLRSPHTNPYTNKHYHEESGAGSGLLPLLLVDPGTGGAKVKLVAACHDVKTLFAPSTGHNLFVVGGDVPSPLTAAGVTATIGASESSITIDDDAMVAMIGVRPIDVRVTKAPGTIVNTATNPRRAMDVFDETSFATLAAGSDKLVLQLPNLGPLGTITAVDVVMCYSGLVGNAGNINVRPCSTADALGTLVAGAANVTVPTILTGGWSVWDQTWGFGGVTDIYVTPSVGGSTLKVFWVALRVTYRPQRDVVTPGSTTLKKVHHYAKKPRWLHRGWDEVVPVVIEPVFSVNGQFYANYAGKPDDGSGTYTGVATAVIQRPCDIARWLLAVKGGETSFETGASAFGSFVLARALLKNASPADFKLALWIGALSTVQQELQRLATQSLTAYVIDRFTGKWLCHVWKQGAQPDYDLVLSRSQIPNGLEAGRTSYVNLGQAVRVQYGYDHLKGRTQFECYVTPATSSQGYTLPTLRDQRLTIDSTNNKLDWMYSVSTYADTLTSGTAPAIDQAGNMRTRMRTRATADFHVGYGFTVKAGYNDLLDITVGGTEYHATLNPGDYDADAAARELFRALVVALTGSGVSCTSVNYSQVTNKFACVFSGSVTLIPSTCTNALQGCWPVFGFVLNHGGATPTADYERYADRFWACAGADHFALKFLFATGANAAATCAGVYGWSPLADTGSAVDLKAPYARGDRESQCELLRTLYGPRQPTIVTADAIRDENSAQQLRDRLFDLKSRPATTVHFTSRAVPDLQRMRVITFDDSFDEQTPFPRYGSDGSWVGKTFRVLEVDQSLGPSYHIDVYAEEA